jgi:hypothetical protein
MFERQTSLRERLADAVDLMIDFATLGEYGLEPVEKPRRCERHRSAADSGRSLVAADRADRLTARL